MKPSSSGNWRWWLPALPLLAVLSPGWVAAQAPPSASPPASKQPQDKPQPPAPAGAQTYRSVKNFSACPWPMASPWWVRGSSARRPAGGRAARTSTRGCASSWWDFDHIIVQKPDGGVERVIILGEKAAYVPPATPTPAGAAPASGHIELKTTRRGTQHAVQISWRAPVGSGCRGNCWWTPGRTSWSCPIPLLAMLGIDAGEGLRPSEMQTANAARCRHASVACQRSGWGKPGRECPGGLPGGWNVGHQRSARDEETSRFTLTIDDKGNRSTLRRQGWWRPGRCPCRARVRDPPPNPPGWRDKQPRSGWRRAGAGDGAAAAWGGSTPGHPRGDAVRSKRSGLSRMRSSPIPAGRRSTGSPHPSRPPPTSGGRRSGSGPGRGWRC